MISHKQIIIMKYLIVILIITISCSAPGNKDSKADPPEIAKKQSTLKSFDNISIEELNIMVETGNIIKNQFNIRGIIKQKFICPPCPPEAECEQCPPDHIVVSDGKSSITIPCHPVYFMKEEEYRFSLERKKYINGFPFDITGCEKIDK